MIRIPQHRSPGLSPVRVLMVAIGGYGYYYLRTLLDEVPSERAVLAGVVDPLARASRAWPDVEALAVPVCDTVEDFFRTGSAADLAVVASPLHCHVPQSEAALAGGADVLCDKPLAVTVQDARRLMAARDRTGRAVTVGYQWSFSTAIQRVKADLLAGVFGQPRRFVTLCAWPRTPAYYARNSWAGRLRDAQSGALVLDSPANNAMAHFLHNACFLLGPAQALSAMPVEVTAEFSRANDIESADTAACRAAMHGGCEVIFLASHATAAAVPPCFRIECDEAIITYGSPEPTITATSRTGATRTYGDPDATPQFTKLHAAIAGVPDPLAPLCGIEAAMAQTVCVDAMHESAPDIVTVPRSLVHTGQDGAVFVEGLDHVLRECFQAARLPHEAGVTWSRPGRPVSTTSDTRVPGYSPGGSPACGERPPA
ncbi:MAG: Gfo/Idh/MocA family oxidoreductase [Vicinamibacterales bacterium]|nr:Gfo/Idh/MocA family oxidoreductase [Vicinamibacterales bacterium]